MITRNNLDDLLAQLLVVTNHFKNIPSESGQVDISGKYLTSEIEFRIGLCRLENTLADNLNDAFILNLQHVEGEIGNLIVNADKYLSTGKATTYDDFLFLSNLALPSDTAFYAEEREMLLREKNGEDISSYLKIREMLQPTLAPDQSARNDQINKQNYQHYLAEFDKSEKLKENAGLRLQPIKATLFKLKEELKHFIAIKKANRDQALITSLLIKIEKITHQLCIDIASDTAIIGKKDPSRLLEMNSLSEKLNFLHKEAKKYHSFDTRNLLANMLLLINKTKTFIEESTYGKYSDTAKLLNEILADENYQKYYSPHDDSEIKKLIHKPFDFNQNECFKNFILTVIKLVFFIKNNEYMLESAPGIEVLHRFFYQLGLTHNNQKIHTYNHKQLQYLAARTKEIAQEILNQRTLFGNPVVTDLKICSLYFNIAKENEAELSKMYENLMTVHQRPQRR